MPIVLEQRPVISEGAARLVAISFVKELDAGTLLTGAPTVVELGTVNFEADGDMELDDDEIPEYTVSTDLTLTNKAVSTTELVILQKRVAIGKAVQFRMSGQVKGKTYVIKVTVSTNSSPSETFVHYALVRCI